MTQHLPKSSSSPPPSPSFPTKPFADSSSALPPADHIIALRIVGTSLPEIVLSPDQRVAFTVGSATEAGVDIAISSLMLNPAGHEHVSKCHAMIVRKGNRIWIKDQSSTNGVYFEERREDAFEVAAGKTFRIADVTLLALDQALRDLRPRIATAIGYDAHAAVDRALSTIAAEGPLALVGEPGCRQDELALDIHRYSARRAAPFTPLGAHMSHADRLGVVTGARGGMVVVDIVALEKLTAPLVDALFASEVRPIFLAPDLERIAEQIGVERARLCHPIWIPPLRARRQDVPALLDQVFARLGTGRRAGELGERNLQQLMAHDWPSNMEELDRVARRLATVLDHNGSVRAAARALGERSHTPMLDMLHRLGIELKGDVR